MVVLTRHGATPGNSGRRYVGGATDEGLSREGVLALQLLQKEAGAERVYTSGMLRTTQTAAILYPGTVQIPVPDLREMEFGRFEGKGWRELENDPAYRKWVEEGCRGRCPEGESRAEFTSRCCSAFRQILAREQDVGGREAHLVVHGGTIMALLSSFVPEERDYFSFTTPPGGRWLCRWNGNQLRTMRQPEEEGPC